MCLSSSSLFATFYRATNKTWPIRLARDQDQAVVSDRIASLVDAETQSDAKIDAHFAELMERLEKGNRTLSKIEEVSNAVLSTV